MLPMGQRSRLTRRERQFDRCITNLPQQLQRHIVTLSMPVLAVQARAAIKAVRLLPWLANLTKHPTVRTNAYCWKRLLIMAITYMQSR